MNNVQPDLLYAVRGYYQHKPLTFITLVFLVSVALISGSLRVAECKSMSTDVYVAYSNVIWMTAMTMTTVGFGDMTPVTPLGRIVVVVCGVWGVLILAVMVGVLTSILSLNNKETQSVMILKKL
jgi:voltage-gated potassium channel